MLDITSNLVSQLYRGVKAKSAIAYRSRLNPFTFNARYADLNKFDESFFTIHKYFLLKDL